MLRGLTVLGLGAGMMYFLDPDHGRRRRALMRDRTVHLLRELDDTIDTTTRDLTNRTAGVVAEARHMWDNDDAPDTVIEARVRSQLGRVVSHPRAIEVRSRGGHVTLRGLVLTGEAERAFDAAHYARGVRGVDNQMELHDEPGNVPALQGGVTRRGSRPELLQENWSPTARLMIGAGAAALLFNLAGRGSALRLGLCALGLALGGRALTLGARQAESQGRGRRSSRPSRMMQGSGI